MEVHPGVFVSNASTQEWEDDPEVEYGAQVHVLCEADGVQAGLTLFPRDTGGPVPWAPPMREVILVLEGEVRIDIQDGPTLELKPGDMASLPKDAQTAWHLTTPFKELWVLS